MKIACGYCPPPRYESFAVNPGQALEAMREHFRRAHPDVREPEQNDGSVHLYQGTPSIQAVWSKERDT